MTPDKTDVENDDKPRRFRPELSRFELVYLSLSDILSVAMIVLDMSYLGGFTELDAYSIFFANIAMVTVSFFGYQMKKRARRRVLRQLKKSEEVETENREISSNLPKV